MSENKPAPVAQPSQAVATPALPEATLEDHEYELWGQNARADFYTADQMRTYGAACASAAPAPVAQASEFEAWYDTVVKYVEPADIAAWMRDAWDAGRASALRSAQAQNDNPSKWERNGYF